MFNRNYVPLTVWAVAIFCVRSAAGETVIWNIDSQQSWVRLNIPMQNVVVDGVEIDNASLNGAQPVFDVTPGAPNNPPVVPWTDDRGARAPVTGSLTSAYEEGVSISFSSGEHNASLVETGQWIPNREKWDGTDFAFHKPEEEGHPAAFASEVTIGGLLRLGHVTLYNVNIDVSGSAPLSGGSGSWTGPGGTLTAGGAEGSTLDFWNQLFRPIIMPSRSTNSSFVGLNSGSLTIEDLGQNDRKLTIQLDLPLTLEISGLPLVGTITGQIVAYADLTPAAVVEESFVYHSSFTSGSPIDTGKSLAKEGEGLGDLSFANLINSAQGINGVVFDIQNLADGGALNADDFEFQVSPTGVFDQGANPPANWNAAPAPSSVSVTAGSPDRVLIQWGNGSIVNRWLRVTVKATANTGLAEPEVYYVGHLLGETTGLSGSVYTVAFADITPIRSAVGNTANASSTVDIDKNGIVNFADISAMRSNVGAQLSNITIP